MFSAFAKKCVQLKRTTEWRGIHMEKAKYRFTAFENTGETLFNEVWEFTSDEEAKEQGKARIEEKGVTDKTHRLINGSGKILIYHV